MSTEHPEGSGYERIKSKMTLREVLETASSFEKTAFEFYSSLTERVSKRLRPLVEELAAEEQGHLEMFIKLSERNDVQAQVAQKVRTPPSDHKFSDYIQTPDLGKNPDDQAILQYAMGREQAAMEQYTSLAAEAPDGPIKELFTFLAHEELEHKKELEKRYYEIVHSGGV